jgi:hypothetical protein
MKRRAAQSERFLKREEVDIHSTFLNHSMRVFPEIQTFEDSPHAISIPVWEKDIADGKPGNPAMCAGSVAACRNVPGVTGALINKSKSMLVFNKTRAVLFRTPYSTYAKLIAFDIGGRVEPGQIALSPVPPSSRLVSMQGRVARRRAMTGRRHATKGQSRPPAKKRAPKKPRGSVSLLVRTWGKAHIPSTLAQAVEVPAEVATA